MYFPLYVEYKVFCVQSGCGHSFFHQIIKKNIGIGLLYFSQQTKKKMMRSTKCIVRHLIMVMSISAFGKFKWFVDGSHYNFLVSNSLLLPKIKGFIKKKKEVFNKHKLQRNCYLLALLVIFPCLGISNVSQLAGPVSQFSLGYFLPIS